MKKPWVLSYPLSAQRRLRYPPRLIYVFAGRTLILLVSLCRGSNVSVPGRCLLSTFVIKIAIRGGARLEAKHLLFSQTEYFPCLLLFLYSKLPGTTCISESFQNSIILISNGQAFVSAFIVENNSLLVFLSVYIIKRRKTERQRILTTLCFWKYVVLLEQ